MRLKREGPHVQLLAKSEGAYFIAVETLANFRASWEDGDTFWSGPDLYGATINIRLADIVGTMLLTQATIDLYALEATEIRERAMRGV